jgi:hypothetical protein
MVDASIAAALSREFVPTFGFKEGTGSVGVQRTHRLES